MRNGLIGQMRTTKRDQTREEDVRSQRRYGSNKRGFVDEEHEPQPDVCETEDRQKTEHTN